MRMKAETTEKKKPLSADWLVQGVLTKIGDALDRLTGRGWKPSSTLATSELSERLKSLVDAEARVEDDNRTFIPHFIALKMQWDKFSTDSESALKKLEHELLTALVDHINDRRYYTYGPISLTVKPDYFTTGIKLFASFDKAAENDHEGIADVTLPGLKVEVPENAFPPEASPAEAKACFRFEIGGKPLERVVEMKAGDRRSVGRTKENDLALDDDSVSKLHASLLFNRDGELVVADTGSTNGTFVDGERIAYGKAIPVRPGQKLRFGSIDVAIEVIKRPAPEPPVEPDETPQAAKTVRIGEFEFSQKLMPLGEKPNAAPTLPSIPMPESRILKPPLDNGNASNSEGSEETRKDETSSDT